MLYIVSTETYLELDTENPRVENTAIRPAVCIQKAPIWSGVFYVWRFSLKEGIPVFFSTWHYRQWLKIYVGIFGFLFVSSPGKA